MKKALVTGIIMAAAILLIGCQQQPVQPAAETAVPAGSATSNASLTIGEPAQSVNATASLEITPAKETAVNAELNIKE